MQFFLLKWLYFLIFLYEYTIADGDKINYYTVNQAIKLRFIIYIEFSRKSECSVNIHYICESSDFLDNFPDFLIIAIFLICEVTTLTQVSAPFTLTGILFFFF